MRIRAAQLLTETDIEIEEENMSDSNQGWGLARGVGAKRFSRSGASECVLLK